VTQWIQLVGKDGESEPVRGDLCVQMQWVFNEGFNELKPIKLDVDAADSSSVDGGAGGSAGEVLDSEVDKEAARKAVEESMALLEQQRSSMKLGEGDYQVQVHVIEVRDLKAEDLCGTSDPVVVVEVAGKKQSTAIKSKTLNAVFDEVLFFSLHKVGASALEKIVIRAAVYDSNTVMKDVLIGLYQFDFMDVYYAPNHEVRVGVVARLRCDREMNENGADLASVGGIGGPVGCEGQGRARISQGEHYRTGTQ
jgi:hypothetical protein